MKKTYTKTGQSCKVTFEFENAGDVKQVALLGDFNEWDASKHVMKRRKDGSYSITVSLKPGSEYKYRYLADGENWFNDPGADKYVPNSFGTEDSVVTV